MRSVSQHSSCSKPPVILTPEEQIIEDKFQGLIDYYNGDDTNDWSVSIEEPYFNQERCFPEGSESVMIKLKLRVHASLNALMDNLIDFEIRAKWDNQMYDFQTLEKEVDWSYAKIYYAIKSPFGVSDRDFVLAQYIRKDYPEPGQISLHVASIPTDTSGKPLVKGRVRAEIKIVGYIITPLNDLVTGEEVCDCFMVSSVDINGLVPKWIVNMASQDVPRKWFKQYEKASIAY